MPMFSPRLRTRYDKLINFLGGEQLTDFLWEKFCDDSQPIYRVLSCLIVASFFGATTCYLLFSPEEIRSASWRSPMPREFRILNAAVMGFGCLAFLIMGIKPLFRKKASERKQ